MQNENLAGSSVVPVFYFVVAGLEIKGRVLGICSKIAATWGSLYGPEYVNTSTNGSDLNERPLVTWGNTCDQIQLIAPTIATHQLPTEGQERPLKRH